MHNYILCSVGTEGECCYTLMVNAAILSKLYYVCARMQFIRVSPQAHVMTLD